MSLLCDQSFYHKTKAFMYELPYFKEKDAAIVLDFIHQHPFAFITGCDENNQPVATQIPVFIEEKGGRLFLSGHLMRNTDHHKAFLANPEVLCVLLVRTPMSAPAGIPIRTRLYMELYVGTCSWRDHFSW
jgi:hypothetical protein